MKSKKDTDEAKEKGRRYKAEFKKEDWWFVAPPEAHVTGGYLGKRTTTTTTGLDGLITRAHQYRLPLVCQWEG